MLNPIQEAAISAWWVIAAGFIVWLLWAARRYATRHPKEPSMRVTDPVCGMTFDADPAVAKVAHAGNTYYFCGEACRKRFAAAPDHYASRASQESSGHH
jgi:YHS domain-containing protein